MVSSDQVKRAGLAEWGPMADDAIERARERRPRSGWCVLVGCHGASSSSFDRLPSSGVTGSENVSTLRLLVDRVSLQERAWNGEPGQIPPSPLQR